MRGASRTAPRQETRPTTFAPISVYSRLFFDQLVATGISDLTRPCQVSGFDRALHVYVAPPHELHCLACPAERREPSKAMSLKLHSATIGFASIRSRDDNRVL